MSRVALDSVSNPSSTAARILAYMKATELSDVLEASDDASRASKPISTDQPAPKFAAEPVQAYQNKLKYARNADFHLDSNNSFPMSGPNSLNSNNANSIPNTFKYKSHPNARTKQTLGKMNEQSDQRRDSLQNSQISVELDNQKSHTAENGTTDLRQPDDGPVRTSTLSKKNTLDFNSTPDWIPPELGEKWNEENFSSSVRINRQSPNTQVDLAPLFLLSTNTMIHNSKQGDTPAWKKASKQFQEVRKSQPQLQNIFASELLNPETKSDNRFHDSISNSMTSTTSNSMASVPLHLSKDQLQHLEHLLEQEGVPAYVPNPESPLKLFGDKYNTFTKDKLADVLQKMNKPPKFEIPDTLNYTQHNSSVQEESEEVKMPTQKQEPTHEDKASQPKFMIRDFTKSGSYSEQQFLQNANNIFSNIQKRGFKTANEKDQMQTTATSTPKNAKVIDDDYSSFTTGFDDESSSISASKRGDDDYTSVGSRESHSFHNSTQPVTTNNDSRLSVENLEKLDSLSFVDTVDETGAASNYIAELHSPSNDYDFQHLRSRLNELEHLVTTDHHQVMEQLKNENKQLRDIIRELGRQERTSVSRLLRNQTSGLADHSFNDAEQLIKWKRASQLGLRHRKHQSNEFPRPTTVDHNDENSLKAQQFRHDVGKIKPSNALPTSYNNMVLDVENQRWIPNDKENDMGGSLDSIEDLETMNERENSILKPTDGNRVLKAKNHKQEVSFHLPHESETSTPKRRSPMPGDVTQVSQLDDVTFTQTHKKLVSLLTETIPESLWGKVTDVNLSALQLDSVEGLADFLPNLVSANIADNNIKFLAGIPESILLLNASKNDLRNVTSFQNFQALQQLLLADNNLSLVENLRHNVHLNRLLLANNQISSLNGLEGLRNLIYLDLSRNLLSGEIDFSNFDLPNVQEINLSDNRITSIVGIERLHSLRILNVNDNSISRMSCEGVHPLMKKLLVKSNKLRLLDVGAFPFLRVLRFDGNYLRSVENLHKLEHLDEISLKSQHKDDLIRHVLQNIVLSRALDLSGNTQFSFTASRRFVGVNCLTMAAMEYDELPSNLSSQFPNLFEINLNFNRLNVLSGLEGMCNLKRVFLVSNNIFKIKDIISSLSASRDSLEVLDLRLNPINVELYPYVFSPNEVDADDPQPIQLETLDDIESFAIHYRALTKNTSNWEERDSEYIEKKISRNQEKLNQRVRYETLLVNYFPKLRKLDGIAVTKEKRRWCKDQLRDLATE